MTTSLKPLFVSYVAAHLVAQQTSCEMFEGESFQTHILLQNFVLIQPRTSFDTAENEPCKVALPAPGGDGAGAGGGPGGRARARGLPSIPFFATHLIFWYCNLRCANTILRCKDAFSGWGVAQFICLFNPSASWTRPLQAPVAAPAAPEACARGRWRTALQAAAARDL